MSESVMNVISPANALNKELTFMKWNEVIDKYNLPRKDPKTTRRRKYRGRDEHMIEENNLCTLEPLDRTKWALGKKALDFKATISCGDV